ncbi:MAG: nucleotide exchange factor GrpE [Rickettsiales bacterium]|nr:nucleotide exchange factor GrpE [Rickettsiales bacterium]
MSQDNTDEEFDEEFDEDFDDAAFYGEDFDEDNISAEDTMISSAAVEQALKDNPIIIEEEEDAAISHLSEEDLRSVEALEGKVESLEARVEELREELMRSVAETENVRKRAERDVKDANKYAVTNFARDMVSVLENLQRATDSMTSELRNKHKEVDNLAMGVEMTHKELLSVFEKAGIKRVDPMGEVFNHNYHQAMGEVENDEVEIGTVMEVMRAGYVIHDRLLMPALVIVSKLSGQTTSVDTEA